MPSLETFAVFAVAALALLVLPGPAVLYIVTRSVAGGRPAGLASAAGVATGSSVQVLLAAAGVATLLVRSALLFSVVKYLGAAYLIGIGLRKVLRPSGDLAAVESAATPRSLGRIYRQGVVVNTFNPKTALFLFAFLPQFVDPARGSAGLQTFLLGMTLVGIGLCTDSTYAMAASFAGARLRASERRAKLTDRASGVVFIGLGILAALTERPSLDSART